MKKFECLHKNFIVIVLALSFLSVLLGGCGQTLSAGSPSIHGSLTWKSNKYYLKTNNNGTVSSLDKSKIGKQLSPPAIGTEKPYVKNNDVYKIKGVDPSKALALKVSSNYWEYTRKKQ